MTCSPAASPRRARTSSDWLVLVGLLTAVLLASATFVAPAGASAIIGNGTVQLGVDDFGFLTVPGGPPAADGTTTNVALRYMPNNAEGLGSDLSDGWGSGPTVRGRDTRAPA